MKKKNKFPIPLLRCVECPNCAMPLLLIPERGFVCPEGISHTKIIPMSEIQSRLVKSFYAWEAADPRNPSLKYWKKRIHRLARDYCFFQKCIFLP